MNSKLLHTPDGVRDSYGDEYEKRLKLELKLHEVLKKFGYKDIKTPSFEYYDIFDSEIGTTPQNELYKFFDNDNNTLVLRPDFTPGVARAAAKYFIHDNETVKLSYMGNVFSNNSSYQGKLKEKAEIGAEFMGDASVEADAEMIKLTVELLKASGLKDFQVCIGNAFYFKGLCRQAALSEKAELKLREQISNKNLVSASEILDENGITGQVRDAILKCVDLFGDESILDDAAEAAGNETALNAVNRLKQVYEELKKTGIEKHITFDLGMLSKYNYYTGIIFRAYTHAAGEPVIKGGRYDDLLKKFGKDCPATGLTLCVDDICQALQNPGNKEPAVNVTQASYLTFALTKGRLALKTLDMLEEIGIFCDELRDKETRKLIFTNEEKRVRFFLAKGPDVPTYVENGAADIGVVGKDTIMEENRKLFEVLDLGFGKCRMCICGPESARDLLKHQEMIRVATKYPLIARDYFQNTKHQTVDIIKLNGSIELAPIVGLSDVICDIVETGSTLRENGLVVLEEVCPLSARMVVNQVSMRLEAERIRAIINALRGIIK
ncbi:MAG: ATP phosphoribosyltransferase regulatory subunit [Lachnospiraceae bacterium]|nr:ATP phosphoribosyltransferase regulatory subunit [Lachnospiraceae bacterium]